MFYTCVDPLNTSLFDTIVLVLLTCSNRVNTFTHDVGPDGLYYHGFTVMNNLYYEWLIAVLAEPVENH